MRIVEVLVHDGFLGVFAGRDIRRDERVFPLQGVPCEAPSRYTIQIGRNEHLGPGDEDPPWKYLNHGCDPNVALILDEGYFVALRDIPAGEELRFNYLTTEWDMAEPFQCHCGAAACFGRIAGFRHLDGTSQLRLLDHAAEHVREMMRVANFD